MRNTTKLLPVLLLGSALTGCSMAGTSDFSTNHNSQAGYWGADSSSCNQPSPCEQAYAQAPQEFASQQGCAVQPAFTGQPAYAEPQGCGVQPGFTGQQGFSAQPGFSGQQEFVGQQGFAGQQAFAGQQGFAGQQAFAGQQGFAGQQAFAGQQGFGAPAFVPPFANNRGRSGLRQAYTYGSLGATLYDVDSDFIGIQGRLGWQSKSFFGAEIEGSVGLSDDDAVFDFGTGPVDSDVEIDTQIAAFAVARYPVSQQFNVLGRVGYHNTELDAESNFDDGLPELEDDFSTDGFAYGIGVEYAFNNNTSVRADYTVYDFDGPDADAISLAISRKF